MISTRRTATRDLLNKMEKYIVPPDEELDQLFKKTFTSPTRPDYINYKGFVVPDRFREFEKSINEFEVRDSDVWICGFPKTGTTWIAEIAWLIAHDLDYEGAKEMDHTRIGRLDLCFIFDYTKNPAFRHEPIMKSIDYCKSLKNPRTIKSHLPFPFLPEQIRNGRGKVICTARNPMDVCVSHYHHSINFDGFTGTLDEFCKLFLHGKINYGPYPEHALPFWNARENPNILFLTYEEMKKDISKVLRTVADFLGKNLTESDYDQLAKYVSFKQMKDNPAVSKKQALKSAQDHGIKLVSPFIRKGTVGGYKTEMSQDFIHQFDYWMPKKLKGSGLDLLLNI